MSDLTQIEVEGQFASSIRKYLEEFKPKLIVETGLYHGNGSTSIISSLIRDIPIEGAKFFSIECNKASIEIAKENLRNKNLLSFVNIISGLSIPKSLLPDEDDIKREIIEAITVDGIKTDHEGQIARGAFYYQEETKSYDRENCLGYILDEIGDPEFVLLDSGGHIGNLEFHYLIGNLNKPCAIALDDTRHIKHYKSFKWIQEDPRFQIINDNDEKFGSALCKFTP